MTTEKWEIDVQEWCLDDVEALQRIANGEINATEIKETLGRLIINKTPEEIGKIKFKDLNKAANQLIQTVQEMAVPKERATP